MGGKRAETLLFLMERIELFTLERLWDRLSDDEFFWEPAPGAWGVRRREDCRSATPFGGGAWVADFDHEVALAADEGKAVEPITTVGWLLWHIGSVPDRLTQVDFFGGSRTMASGWTSPYLTHHPVFASATDAVETLRNGWDALKAALDIASDQQMEQRTARYTYSPLPPSNGLAVLGPPGEERPAIAFVATTLNEISHHGSQICMLRDLHRIRDRPS
jgi:hypothetical protein